MVLPPGLQPADLAVELVVKPDQIGDHRIEYGPGDSVLQTLVFAMQVINDRFTVCRPAVKGGQLFLDPVEALGQIGQFTLPDGSGRLSWLIIGCPGCVGHARGRAIICIGQGTSPKGYGAHP